MNAAGKRFLYTAFSTIEEIYKSRLFLKKLKYEESQIREITFYKDIMKKNVSVAKLEAMLATYNAEKKVPDQKFPHQLQLPSPESSQNQPSRPAIEAKSVSWSVDPPEVRRSILKPGSGYASGYGYGGYEAAGDTGAAESRGVVNTGSVVASVGAGYGPSDQGVG